MTEERVWRMTIGQSMFRTEQHDSKKEESALQAVGVTMFGVDQGFAERILPQ